MQGDPECPTCGAVVPDLFEDLVTLSDGVHEVACTECGTVLSLKLETTRLFELVAVE